VVRHPQHAHILGLKTLSTAPWVLTEPGRSSSGVDPGRSATIANDNRIQFGQVDGTIRAS